MRYNTSLLAVNAAQKFSSGLTVLNVTFAVMSSDNQVASSKNLSFSYAVSMLCVSGIPRAI